MTDQTMIRAQLLDALQHIGREAQGGGAPHWMSREQAASYRTHNPMTDARWQLRSLAGGAMLVEISFAEFMGEPLFGVTVWHKREEDKTRDHERSRACHSVQEVVDYVRELNRQRVAA